MIEYNIIITTHLYLHNIICSFITDKILHETLKHTTLHTYTKHRNVEKGEVSSAQHSIEASKSRKWQNRLPTLAARHTHTYTPSSSSPSPHVQSRVVASRMWRVSSECFFY